MGCCALSRCGKCGEMKLHDHITLVNGRLVNRSFCDNCDVKSKSKFRGERLW